MDKYSPRQGLFLLGVLLFSQLASASPLTKQLYVSADGGIFEGKFNSRYNDLTDVIPQNVAQQVQQYGYTGGVGLGYTKLICHQFLAGAEFDAQFNSHQANFASGSATTAFSDNLQIRQNFDLTFVPGVLVADATALYAKLGVTYGQIKSQLTSPTGFTPTYVSLNSSQYNWGGTLTLGVKHYFSEYGAVFAEYGYHDFGTSDFANFPNFTATYSHSERVYSQAVLAGVSYYFF